jgi:hypothetical protein
VGHAGRPVDSSWQDEPAKYLPTTRNFTGTLPSNGTSPVPAASLDQISSKPNAIRVGTPVTVCRVGSGWTHRLYQPWTPGW